jgi:uncharacterized Zn finger protein
MYDDFKPYVSAAQRKERARRAAQRLREKGGAHAPVVVSGTAIAKTFWGLSWCRNIERYADFRSRLDRGRAYLRTGAVVDLAIAPGVVKALVMGSRLYTVEVKIAALPKARWDVLCGRCAGAIDSLVELLQGRLSKSVMEHICAPQTGLFPWQKEIAFTCTCPDWASMCKHVAAVLYGIGARLDEQPALLFALREVDEKALIAGAAGGFKPAVEGRATGKRLERANLSKLFGIEIAEPGAQEAGKGQRGRRGGKRRG